jgi:hypothetical protein
MEASTKIGRLRQMLVPFVTQRFPGELGCFKREIPSREHRKPWPSSKETSIHCRPLRLSSIIFRGKSGIRPTKVDVAADAKFGLEPDIGLAIGPCCSFAGGEMSPAETRLLTQQGGSLVFSGEEVVFKHVDSGILKYTDVDALVAAALQKKLAVTTE